MERSLAYSAYALGALGEAERAKERMNRALLIDPDNWNMRYNFGCVLIISLERDRRRAGYARLRHSDRSAILRGTLAPRLAAIAAGPSRG